MALLRASVSEAGLEKATDIMALQSELGNDLSSTSSRCSASRAAPRRGAGALQGHHLSRHFTVAGDRVVATPFFNGAWPNETDAGLKAMPREEDAARELISSLDEATRAAAIFQGRTLTSHVTQNQPYVQPLEPIGVALGQLGGQQRALAVEMIQTDPASLPDSIAKPSFERSTRRGSTASASAGPATWRRAGRTTTGCRARRSRWSSTTGVMAARTSIASGGLRWRLWAADPRVARPGCARAGTLILADALALAPLAGLAIGDPRRPDRQPGALFAVPPTARSGCCCWWPRWPAAPAATLTGRASATQLRRPLGLYAFAYIALHLLIYALFDGDGFLGAVAVLTVPAA